MTSFTLPRSTNLTSPTHLLAGIKQTARQALLHSPAALLDEVSKQLDVKLTSFDTPHLRELANLSRELTVHRLNLEEGLGLAVDHVLNHPAPARASQDLQASEIEIMGTEQVEAQLDLTRTAHQISLTLEWELADLNTRISYLHQVEGVDASLNPIGAEALARMLLHWTNNSLLSKMARPYFKQAVLSEFSALTAAVYHELNAWLIREGVLPKIDLRAMVLRTAVTERWQQLTAQSLLDWQQPGLAQALESNSVLTAASLAAQGFNTQQGAGGSYGPNTRPSASQLASRLNAQRDASPSGFVHTPLIARSAEAVQLGSDFGSAGLVSIRPLSQVSPATEIEALSRLGIDVARNAGLWTKLKNKLNERFSSPSDAGDSRKRKLGTMGDTGTHAHFDITLLQLLDHVETQVLSTLPDSEQRSFDAKVVASLPRLVQFRDELQAAASNANERATVELVALMFEHILTDESIPPLARVLFARLQIPVLRTAIRENEAFMESTHPARDFIDRMGSVVSGYSGEERIDDRLQAEIRRLVLAAEKSPSLTGQFFSRLLYDFELFLERYGRELREVSVLGVPMLEQTEDYKVSAVLYTIELRKLTDDVPCDKRMRDFLLHSWVGVVASIASNHGKESAQVTAAMRLAADMIWCTVPKAAVAERTELVSELPNMMRRVEAAIANAGAQPDAQKKASTRLRGMLLQIIRAPVHQAPNIVFDTLLAKLQQLESAATEAGERSANYRIPLMALRSQIAARALSLQVVEPSDLKLDPSTVAGSAARQWTDTLKRGSWYRIELIKDRPQLLQLAWFSTYRNYLLFAEAQGTSGLITEPNTIALLVERGQFKPLERETLTERATKGALLEAEKTA